MEDDILMMTMEVKLNSSFYKKLNQAAVKAAEKVTIRNTTLEAERRCKIQAPGPGNQLPGTTYKAVGNLRRGHSSEISDEEGLVKNSQKYWVYVVYGTSKMPARNYPKKIVSELSSENYISRTMISELKKQGVIE